jgi:pyruvate dehydrogenase E2 component (dihydrolipoamide acetyltransferase)
MPEIIRMPSVAAGATHAVLLSWLVEPGAQVAVGDLLAEIETEKAVVEYAAETAGELGRFLVQAGDEVAVGDPIAVVLGDGEDASALLLLEEVSPEGLDSSDGTPGPPAPSPQASAPGDAAGAAAAPTPAADRPQAQPQASTRRFVSPVARRVAAERGVDLAEVTGTGPNGRIVRRDVEAHLSRPQPAAAPAPTAAPAPAAARFRDVPLSGMRRAIARRLSESKATVPHFYLTAHPRVDRLLLLRQEINAAAPRKVSVNDFVVKAVARALTEVPAANAVWNEDSIRYFDRVDLGVAIAVENGLLTPVLRGVSELSVTDIGVQIGELAARAREGRLRQHELEGGSFAVSNLGMYGVEEFSAIINPPQSGILAVSAAARRPVVGEDGALTVAQVMTVTLSADHRVIDGATAARWSAALVAALENPVLLLL